MSKELIHSLRHGYPSVLRLQAADRIEELEAKLAALEGQAPIYQFQRADGSWIDQRKSSYDYNVKYGAATVRILYLAAGAKPEAAPAEVEGYPV